jgi:CubicO group peptidase (beta-lactamase class C family)
MRRPTVVASVLVLLAACPSRGKAPVIPDEPPADPRADQILEAVTPLYEDEVLHGGMLVALIDPARKEPTYLAFGRTSPEVAEPPARDAIFEIGSVSKVLTSLLLADLVERGELALDTPAQQLLPLGVRFPDAGGERPTLEHLASHRAGFPPLPENLVPESMSDPYAGYGPRQLYAYLERAQLMFPPGEAYAYSNLGAGILGHLLERKTGKPYEQAVHDEVLAPLGLDQTWITIPEKEKARLVPGTTAGGDFAATWQFDVLAGAGAWRSTLGDMVELVQAAIGAAGNKEVPLGAVIRRTLAPVGEAGGGEMQIGLAWHITPEGVVWHNGMTGGYASFIGFDPKTGLGVVALASTASPLVTRIGIGAFDVFAGKPLDLGLDLVKLSETEIAKLVGTYRLADGQQLSVGSEGGKVYLSMGQEKVRIYPQSSTRFLVLELEAAVEFHFDAATGRLFGFVLHMPDGDVPAERVE